MLDSCCSGDSRTKQDCARLSFTVKWLCKVCLANLAHLTTGISSFQFALQFHLAVGNSLFISPSPSFQTQVSKYRKMHDTMESCSSDSQDQYRVYDTAANFWTATELDKRPLLLQPFSLTSQWLHASRQKLLEMPGNSAFPIVKRHSSHTFPEVLQVHPQQRLERDLPQLLFQEAPAEAGTNLELFKASPFVQSFSTARRKKAKHQAERIPRLKLWWTDYPWIHHAVHWYCMIVYWSRSWQTRRTILWPNGFGNSTGAREILKFGGI